MSAVKAPSHVMDQVLKSSIHLSAVMFTQNVLASVKHCVNFSRVVRSRKKSDLCTRFFNLLTCQDVLGMCYTLQ